MDVDDELGRHSLSLRQLVLLNKLAKERLIEMQGYWKEILQYAYDMNEIGTQACVNDATSHYHGWEFFSRKTKNWELQAVLDVFYVAVQVLLILH